MRYLLVSADDPNIRRSVNVPSELVVKPKSDLNIKTVSQAQDLDKCDMKKGIKRKAAAYQKPSSLEKKIKSSQKSRAYHG